MSKLESIDFTCSEFRSQLLALFWVGTYIWRGSIERDTIDWSLLSKFENNMTSCLFMRCQESWSLSRKHDANLTQTVPNADSSHALKDVGASPTTARDILAHFAAFQNSTLPPSIVHHHHLTHQQHRPVHQIESPAIQLSNN